MKVKIFSHGREVSVLEKNINDWIEKEKPNIKNVLQSQTYDPDDKLFSTLVTIFYEGPGEWEK